MSFNSVPLGQRPSLPRYQPDIGHFIRDLRLLLGYTQEQFSMVLGVSFSTLNRWENGRMQPSPLAHKQIESVFEKLNQTADPTLQASRKELLEKFVSP